MMRRQNEACRNVGKHKCGLPKVLSSRHVLIYSLVRLFRNFAGGELMKSLPVEYADASPGVQAVYDDVLQTMQRTDLPNWIKYLGSNEKILKKLGEVSLHDNRW